VCTDLFFLIIYFVVGVLVIRFLFSDGDIDLIENCAKEAGTGSVRSSAFRVRSVGVWVVPVTDSSLVYSSVGRQMKWVRVVSAWLGAFPFLERTRRW
jgi:hypothetical protein